MCGIGIHLLLLDLADDGVDVKQSCAIVAAVYLLFFALVWHGFRPARFVFAGGTWRRVPTEATTNTPSSEPEATTELVRTPERAVRCPPPR